MATSLPPERPATERELIASPEQWMIVSVGAGFVTYMDRRARMLTLPLKRTEPPLPTLVEADGKG